MADKEKEEGGNTFVMSAIRTHCLILMSSLGVAIMPG
jgi:hypothetical protein